MDAQASLLAAIAARLLARSDDLVRAQVAELRRFAAYDRVPDEDLRRSCLRNVARVVATLEQRDTLPAEIEEDERASGQRRALQGVPTEDVVRAYRAVIGILRDAFIEEASAAAADPWQVLAGTRKLWDLTDRYSDVLVAARQQVDIDTARRDEQRRITVLHRLVAGNLDPSDLSAGGAVQDMLPNRDYWVLRGRHYGGDTQRLARHLESTGTSFRPLVAPFDNDIVAICAAWPAPAEGAIIAVGGPVRLSAVPLAFAEATRVLNVAVRYRRTGVADSSALSVRMAVEEHDGLGEQLIRRHLAPVAARPGSAEILDTLRTYLDQGRSILTTATALSVHPNTIRYRLARFQSLAGADLASTDTLVEIWWALEYAAIRRVPLDAMDAIDARGDSVPI
jgi:PucR C-terminal helix-turn-helix domain